MNLDPYFLWQLFTGSLRLLDKRNRKGSNAAADPLSSYVSVLVELADPTHWLAEFNFIPTHTNSVVSGAMRSSFRPGIVPLGRALDLFLNSHLYSDGPLRVELSRPRAQREVDQPRQQVTAAVIGSLLNRPTDAQGWSSAQALPFGVGFLGIDGAMAARETIPTLPTLEQLLRVEGTVLPPVWRRPGSSKDPVSRRVVVCVIDDGCNFAAASLCSSNVSKVRSILIQGVDDDAGDSLAEAQMSEPALAVSLTPSGQLTLSGATVGRVLPTQSLTGSSDPLQPPQVATSDEPGAYRKTGYLWPSARSTHGAAMLDLIMSPDLWIADRPVERRNPEEVLFVQLPPATVLDTSGGSLGAFVIDGIHEALQSAGTDCDVVVNLSFGTHGGGHDGTSMFERALKELLDKYDGGTEAAGRRLHVVLPAGNSHRLRCHASGWCRPGHVDSMYWHILPDDESDNFVEVWVPKGSEVEISIQGPSLETRIALKLGTGGGRGYDYELLRRPASKLDGKRTLGAAFGLLVAVPEPVQSTKGSMFLVALSANALDGDIVDKVDDYLKDNKRDGTIRILSIEERARSPGPLAQGIWEIGVRATGHDPVAWDAWVQRSDVAPLRGRVRRGVMSRQSHFVDIGRCQADPTITLNGIATLVHERLHVVGASFRDDNRISDYSSAGPNRDCDKRTSGPDWVVPADESWNRRGLLVRGVPSGSRQRVSGTSAAAASFTRHLWEHLQDGRPLAGLACVAQSSLPDRQRGVEAPCEAADWLRGECNRIESRPPDANR